MTRNVLERRTNIGKVKTEFKRFVQKKKEDGERIQSKREVLSDRPMS